MKRVVIIGAGISGLSAAKAIASQRERTGKDVEILVLEKANEVGGKALSRSRDGYVMEQGPGGYLDSEPTMDRLVKLAGLSAHRVQAAKDSAKRFIVHRHRAREVKTNPVGLLRSGLIGPLSLLRIMCEPLIRRGKFDDESVWDFAARRLGKIAANQLISPMVLGIFAGDAKLLSLPASFPSLAKMEKDHGSLIRGMIARKNLKRKDRGGPSGPLGTLTSFREGLQSLPIALASDPNIHVQLGTEVDSVVREGNRYGINMARGKNIRAADAVVLAQESFSMARCVRDLDTELETALQEIAYPPVVVVSLAYDSETKSHFPRGFGALVPMEEGLRMLGCLWESHIFPGRSPTGGFLIRVMLGGSTDPDILRLDDEELMRIVKSEFDLVFKVKSAPLFHNVTRWTRAIPQYEIGHLRRVLKIEASVRKLPGLFLAGNALHGIAFSKAAKSGWNAGMNALEYLEQLTSFEPAP